MSLERFRVLGWVIPILCTATSGFFIYRENSAFNQASEDRNKARIEAQQALQEQKLIETLPEEKKYATVEASPTEEYTFVTSLRSMAVKCNTKVSSWTSDSSEQPREGNQKGQQEDPLMKGIVKISANLLLQGSYSNIRTMISTLETSDRLLTLSNLVWTREANDSTSLALKVTRYVVPKKDQKVSSGLQIKSS